MSMRMVVVMMAGMSMLAAFSSARTKRCASLINALTVKRTILVLDSLRFSAVLRTHFLEPEVVVKISTWREGLLRTLRHRTASRWGRTPEPTKTGEHSSELALDVWIFPNRQRLRLGALHSLRKWRGSASPAVDVRTKA